MKIINKNTKEEYKQKYNETISVTEEGKVLVCVPYISGVCDSCTINNDLEVLNEQGND